MAGSITSVRAVDLRVLYVGLPNRTDQFTALRALIRESAHQHRDRAAAHDLVGDAADDQPRDAAAVGFQGDQVGSDERGFTQDGGGGLFGHVDARLHHGAFGPQEIGHRAQVVFGLLPILCVNSRQPARQGSRRWSGTRGVVGYPVRGNAGWTTRTRVYLRRMVNWL